MSRRAGLTRGPLPWLGGLLALYLLVPIGAFVWRFGHLEAGGGGAFGEPGLVSALGVSLVSSTLASVVIAILGIPLAYALAHFRGWPAQVIGVAIQLPLALPPLMSGILMLSVVGPYTRLGQLFGGRLTDSLTGIVLAQIFVAAPFLIIAARSAFAAVDPALVDVAATLGHGPASRFFRVSLPLALPGIWAGLLLAWLRAFGEFGATVILAYHPYSLPVFTFVQFGSTGLTATSGPVAVALLAALAVLGLSQLRPRRRRSRRFVRPAPVPPPLRETDRLTFNLAAQLGEFSLAVAHQAEGPHLALLGPSGAGKSLTLRLLAGLLRGQESQVRWGVQELGTLPVECRQLGYVPQDASLFPHLDVWRQVTFGVGVDPGIAAFWIDTLRLGGLEGRYPRQLSGGQQRRVAMARALARNPRLVLLDEPFTGLDTPVRDELRRALRRIQQTAGLTTVLVTHDPEEAALLSEEVLVMDGGRVLQAGQRESVYARPASRQVAELLGIRNLAPGTVVGPEMIASNGIQLRLPGRRLPIGRSVTWYVRPEQLRLHDDCQTPDAYQCTIVDAVDLGAIWEIVVRLGNGGNGDQALELTARTMDGERSRPGMVCQISLPPESIGIWLDDDETLLGVEANAATDDTLTHSG